MGVRDGGRRQERGVVVCKNIVIIFRIILLVVIVIVVVVIIIIIIARGERNMFVDTHATFLVCTHCVFVHLQLSSYGSLRYSVTRAPRHAVKRERASGWFNSESVQE